MVTRTTRRALYVLVGLSCAALLAAATCCWAIADIEVVIDVSPNVLNLQNQAQVVTVHTEIDCSLVAGATVTLNGITIASWKADDRGDFVAKFSMNDVKDLPLNIDEYNTLTLSGVTRAGDLFTGSQNILVINNVPAGKQ